MAEDIGPGDVTSLALIGEEASGAAVILAKQEGVLAGLLVLEPLAELIAESLSVELKAADGESVRPGQEVVRLVGSCRGLLAVERVGLNFLSHLSGVATLTQKYVQEVRGTAAVICDTRKTIPGLRVLAKYAVRAGGGQNHRLGLYDSGLIKDNHLFVLSRDRQGADALQVLKQGLDKLREQLPPGGFIELEVDNLEQLQQVLDLSVELDMVLLDNFCEQDLVRAVEMRKQAGLAGKLLLEASGNISLDNVRRIAQSGVDRISVGALTHSATALDLTMEFIEK